MKLRWNGYGKRALLLALKPVLLSFAFAMEDTPRKRVTDLPIPFDRAGLFAHAKLVHPQLKSADGEFEFSERLYRLGGISDCRVMRVNNSPQLQLIFWLEPKDQSASNSVIYSLGVYNWTNGHPVLVYGVAVADYNSTADERDTVFDRATYELLPGQRAIAIRSYQRHRRERTTFSLYWPNARHSPAVASLKKVFSESTLLSYISDIAVEAKFRTVARGQRMAGIQMVVPAAKEPDQVPMITRWEWEETKFAYVKAKKRRDTP